MKTRHFVITATSFCVLTSWASLGQDVSTKAPADPAKDQFAPETATVLLPGLSASKPVRYSIIDGDAVLENDIDISNLLPSTHRRRETQVIITHADGRTVTSPHLVATSTNSRLWPGGNVPFVIDGSVGPALRANIVAAVAAYTTQTNLRFTEWTSGPRPSSYAEFVQKNLGGGRCGQSPVGRSEGANRIKLSATAGTNCIMHEMGHVIGLYHEQSRADRDAFVTILIDNVLPERRHDFDKNIDSSISYGSYDCDSLMHYGPMSGGKTVSGVRLTTIVSANPARCPTVGGPTSGFSALDLDQLNRLYPRTVDCRDNPVIFEHLNKTGSSQALVHDYRDLRWGSFGWNNKISSLCVSPLWEVVLFKDPGYTGDRCWITGGPSGKDVNDLRHSGICSGNFNDRVSSVRVTGPGANPVPAGCFSDPILFEHDNFRGRNVTVTADVPDLGADQIRFNDKTSSLCVPPNRTVRFFKDPNYSGSPTVEIHSGSSVVVFSDLHGAFLAPGASWPDTISSVKINP